MTATTKRTVLAVALAAAAALPAGLAAGAPADTADAAPITIDPARRLQRIDGFGASALTGFGAFQRGHFDQVVPRGVTYKTTPSQRKALLTTLVRDLGVSHVRIWVFPAGIERANDNDDPAVMNWKAFTWSGDRDRPQASTMLANRINGIEELGEVLKVAVPLGMTHWILTPGNLPGWLMHRLNDPHDKARFAEYAEWAAAHVLYLKKQFGFEAPYWSLFNEPDNRGWTDATMWREWIRALGRRFGKEGLKTKIVFPDYMNVHRAVKLVPHVLADAEVRRYVGALAYHHYRGSGDGPQPFLETVGRPGTADAGATYERITRGARGMAELGRKFALPSWQTETGYYPRFTKKLPEWQIGRARANEIYYELRSGASAVQGMFMLWVDAVDPRYDATVRHEGHHVVMKTDGKHVTGWQVTRDCGAVFAHYARFVRPGDHRVEAACSDPMLRPTAFVGRKEKRVTLVVVNNASKPRRVTIRLPRPWDDASARTRSLLTNATCMLAEGKLRPTRDRQGAYVTQIPAHSLATFVWDAENRTPAPAER